MTTAFLPCRAGSERVPRKNTRPFAGHAYGLVGIKLCQLAEAASIERIVLSTNDSEVIDIAESLVAVRDKLVVDRRPEELCRSSTSTDELVRYVPTVVDTGTVLWTHVTSPMVSGRDYDSIVSAYDSAVASGEADSLMTVNRFQEFLWDARGPVNYDRTVEKWPRTQTLDPLFTVNSAAFVIDAGLMADRGDRVGVAPHLYELEGVKGFDIDWEDQFEIAELIFSRELERRLSSAP